MTVDMMVPLPLLQDRGRSQAFHKEQALHRHQVPKAAINTMGVLNIAYSVNSTYLANQL